MSQNPAIGIMESIRKMAAIRNLLFLLFCAVMLAVFYQPLKELMGLGLKSELYSHIIIIPLVSGYFLYVKRGVIFSDLEYSTKSGVAVIGIGVLLYGIAVNQRPLVDQNDYLALTIFSSVILLIGGVLFFYGIRFFRAALFPLLFLFLMTPLPAKAAERIVFFLQMGSAEAAYGFFKLAGVPVAREGFIFDLPGLSIEVAKQCSGIRSAIALFITSIVAGQIFLRTGWKKVFLVLLAFPISICKNGLRIAVLSLLGVYVDPRILGSELHKSGGIPFFIVALMLLAPILLWLRRRERKELKAGIME